MALFNTSSKVLFGFGLGLAGVRLFREVAPAFRGLGRPLAKATVKSSLILLDKGRVRFAEMQEKIGDLAAEARAEMAADAVGGDPETAAAAGSVPGPGVQAQVYHA